LAVMQGLHIRVVRSCVGCFLWIGIVLAPEVLFTAV
jgi:hypothetical protein